MAHIPRQGNPAPVVPPIPTVGSGKVPTPQLPLPAKSQAPKKVSKADKSPFFSKISLFKFDMAPSTVAAAFKKSQ